MALKGPPLTKEFLYKVPDGTELWMAFTGEVVAHLYELVSVYVNGTYVVRGVKTNRTLEITRVGITKENTRFWLENPDDNLPMTMEELCELPGNTVVWVRYAGWMKYTNWYTDVYECEGGTELTLTTDKREKITLTEIGSTYQDIRVYRKEPGT